MRPLHLLYVGTLPPHRGGSGILFGQLLPRFARAGHRVRALAAASPDVADPVDAFALSHPAVAVTRYPMPGDSTFRLLGSSDPEYQLAEERAIAGALPALMARDRPDVVFLGRESVAWHAADLVARYGVPSILLIQGGSTFAGLVSGGDDRFGALRDRMRGVDRIVAVAEHLALAARRLGLPGVVAIPNPVDLDRFAPAGKDEALLRELGVTGADTIVMHVSNLREIKRPLDLIRSAERCLRTDRRLVYVIVGDGVGREAMRRRCAEAGIADRVRFVGWVDHDRVPSYLNVADVVVLTSEAEGQSLVSLETQACARALLASDITAMREIVTDGETGLLYRSGDVEALAAQTLRLAGDPALREAIGRKARESVQTHDLDRIADRYLEVIAEVAG